MKNKLKLTDDELYMLYETVENNIEELAFKPQRIAPKSGKYQYKWDILQKLKIIIYNKIDWNAPCKNNKDCKVRK